MTNSDYGIWDDGEWISWDSIHAALDRRELQEAYPFADPEVALIFEDLVELAMRYHAATNRYLQIWGELGELYAEVAYGLRRHRPCTAGSDGRLGNDFVEVKTLSPEKRSDKVAVKRAGNFNKLLIVRISEDFEFEARMIDRKKLGNGVGSLAHVRWSDRVGPHSGMTAFDPKRTFPRPSRRLPYHRVDSSLGKQDAQGMGLGHFRTGDDLCRLCVRGDGAKSALYRVAEVVARELHRCTAIRGNRHSRGSGVANC